jgi:predicted ATPase with chaperone activity
VTQLVETSVPYISPAAPSTLAETGLSSHLVTELILKILHRSTELSGTEIGKRLGLSFPIVEPCLDLLKAQRECEISGGPTLGGSSFRYRLTDAGHVQALTALDRNQYIGVAPVPIEQYQRYLREFQEMVPRKVTAEEVHAAFSHLVVSRRVLDEVGPAVNAGQSIFIYGPPGNGKTIMAGVIRTLLQGTIAIPHAIEVADNIIRFFDPMLHEPASSAEVDSHSGERNDRRWIQCRRPMVTVGGELTLESLALSYNPRSGIYHAPVQALANGGVLLVDDFGRQRCSPRDLLNWWMVPLESHVESLALLSGEKLEMPFLALVIFSTNIKPSELVDEAFLRRIQYKIYAENPTPEDFVQIFERCCTERGIPFDRDLVEGLLGGFFRERQIELRACHPRDLIDQALSLASYRGQPRQLTADLLDVACLSYFIDNREAPRTHT